MKEEDKYRKETTAVIASSFEIEGYDETKEYTEAEVLRILSNQVAYFMEARFEQLMSLMYTMDINEYKVRKALEPDSPEPSNVGIAKLIYDRQMQRIRTKHEYGQEGPKDWEDF